jgi:hypothetical protein
LPTSYRKDDEAGRVDSVRFPTGPVVSRFGWTGSGVLRIDHQVTEGGVAMDDDDVDVGGCSSPRSSGRATIGKVYVGPRVLLRA